MELRMLSTASELDRTARLAYDVYVDECGVLGNVADHGRRQVGFDGAEQAQVIGAFEGDQLVGSIAAFCGEDGPFPSLYDDALQVPRFASIVPRERMAIVTRLLIRPSWRGKTVCGRLMHAMWRLLDRRRVRIILGDCQPHLLGLYRALGLRSFGRLFDYGDTSVAVPLVGTPADHEYLRAIKSTALGWLSPESEDRELASQLRDLIADEDPVTPASRPGYWKAVGRALGFQALDGPAGIVNGGTHLVRALESAYLLRCHRGNQLIGRSQSIRTCFLVVAGEIEARAGQRSESLGVGALCDGDVTLLMKKVRADVFVGTQTAEVLSMTERVAKVVREWLTSQSALACGA